MAATDQAKQTQQLHKIANKTEKYMHQLETATTNISKTTSELKVSSQAFTELSNQLRTAVTLAPPPNISTSDTHISSLEVSAKVLAKAVEELKKLPNHSIAVSPPFAQSINQSYANIITNNHQRDTSNQPYNPDAPEHITHIENRLHIQEWQIYIIYDKHTVDSPKEHGGAAALWIIRLLPWTFKALGHYLTILVL